MSNRVAAGRARATALIARRGWILRTGGRNVGVMAASARGAKEAGGLVVGILPDATDRGASPYLDVATCTAMGDARNVINVLSSDVVIACPGRMGTLSEVALALNAGKRVILVGFELCDPPFRKYIKSGRLTTAATPEDALNQVADAFKGCALFSVLESDHPNGV
jgi:hypothetical protein